MENNKLTIKEHLKHCGQTTSVKGISKIIKAKHYALKIVWLIALICGASIAGYLLVTLIMAYLKHETITQITQCSDCQPQFPDVTVCNLNPLAQVSFFPHDLLQFYEYLDILNSFHLMSDDMLMALRRNSNLTEEDLNYLYYGVFYSLSGYFHNVNETKLLEKVDGHIASLVNFCEWYDWKDRKYFAEDCMTQSLYFFTTPDYSVCTTIHLNDSNSLSNNTHVKGFEAVLYLNDFHKAFMIGYGHNILLSQARGARVLIHPPNTLPEMRKGFNIAPGHEVSIHLEAREMIRQPDPYSDCTGQQYLEENVDEPVDGTNQILKFMYSDQDASSLCQQENVIKKCGCLHPSLPVTRHLQSKYNASGCINLWPEDMKERKADINITDLNLVDALRKVACYVFTDYDEKHQQQTEDRCVFRQPCKETTYSHKVYQSPWPHESYQLSFYCRHIMRQNRDCWKVGLATGTSHLGGWFLPYAEALHKLYSENLEDTYERLLDEDLIQRNFIQLKVNFLDQKTEVYKEVASVTLASLTGNMGGVLNLWIGITFFTLIELVDMIYTLIVDVWLKKANKEVKKAQQERKISPLDDGFTTSGYTY